MGYVLRNSLSTSKNTTVVKQSGHSCAFMMVVPYLGTEPASFGFPLDAPEFPSFAWRPATFVGSRPQTDRTSWREIFGAKTLRQCSSMTFKGSCRSMVFLHVQVQQLSEIVA